MANFAVPFAQSASLRYPDALESAGGFDCGAADRDLFNGLFHRVEAELGHLITYSGQTGNNADLEQVRKAIGIMIAAAIAASGGGTGAALPPGAPMMWTTETPPTGFLLMDGALVNRATYAALFAAIGTRYGAGDGVTTFKLPDVRGYFPRFFDGTAGRDPDKLSRLNRGDGQTGNVVGTTQLDIFKSHVHEIGAEANNVKAETWLDDEVGVGDVRWLDTQLQSEGGRMTYARALATGGLETRPLNISFNGIIKY